jgi:hypothetical protein
MLRVHPDYLIEPQPLTFYISRQHEPITVPYHHLENLPKRSDEEMQFLYEENRMYYSSREKPEPEEPKEKANDGLFK